MSRSSFRNNNSRNVQTTNSYSHEEMSSFNRSLTSPSRTYTVPDPSKASSGFKRSQASKIHQSPSASKIISTSTPGGKPATIGTRKPLRASPSTTQAEYKHLLDEFERLKQPIDVQFPKKGRADTKKGAKPEPDNSASVNPKSAMKQKQSPGSASPKFKHNVKISKNLPTKSGLTSPSPGKSGKSKPPAKLAYMEDYKNIRSELMTMVQHETSKVKSKSVATSKAATSFSKSPLTLNLNNRNDINLFQETQAGSTDLVNKKLDELSKLFRENLKAHRTNPMDVIKTPKFSKLSNKALSKLEKDVSPKIFSYGSRLFPSDDEDEDEQGEEPDEEDEAQDSGEMIERASEWNGRVSFQDGRRSLAQSNSNHGKPNANKAPKKPIVKSSKPTDDGIIELRTLLESNSYLVGDNNHFKLNSPQPKPIVEKPKAHNPYLKAQAMLEKYREKVVIPDLPADIFKMAVAKSSDRQASTGTGTGPVMKRYDNNSKQNLTYTVNSSTETDGTLKPRHLSSRRSSDAGTDPIKYETIPADKLKEKLGNSVKTIEDAAKVATALGSLMSRIAATRNNDATIPNNMDYSMKRFNALLGSPSPDPIGIGSGSLSGHSGTQTTTSSSQEIQTDAPAGSPANGSASRRYSLQQKISEIKFTKEMSAEDQFQLQQLRIKKYEWDKF